MQDDSGAGPCAGEREGAAEAAARTGDENDAPAQVAWSRFARTGKGHRRCETGVRKISAQQLSATDDSGRGRRFRGRAARRFIAGLAPRFTENPADAIIRPSPWGYSSAGRALAWHARGQRFDPAYLHHTIRGRTTGRLRSRPTSPSSRGPGHHPFTVKTRVRIPLGTPTIQARHRVAPRGTVPPHLFLTLRYSALHRTAVARVRRHAESHAQAFVLALSVGSAVAPSRICAPSRRICVPSRHNWVVAVRTHVTTNDLAIRRTI
jgi:hypothetical protein